MGTDHVKKEKIFEVGTLTHLTRASFVSHHPQRELFHDQKRHMRHHTRWKRALRQVS